MHMHRVLITDGGPHAPEKWAEVSADQLIKVMPGAAAPAYAFKAKVIEALTAVYGAAMNGERLELDADGDGKLGSPLDPGEYVDDGFAAVKAAAEGTPWEAQFATPGVEAVWRREIGTRVMSILDVERAWHATRSKSETARRWLETRGKHGTKRACTDCAKRKKPGPTADEALAEQRRQDAVKPRKKAKK